jgi:isoquinoline 1-oxidoreductase beta subunit
VEDGGKIGLTHIDGGQTANFLDYPILSMSEAPQIEVHIVKSAEPMGCVGELGVPAIAPAVANAVFAASGIRLRNLPMAPEKVKAGKA